MPKFILFIGLFCVVLSFSMPVLANPHTGDMFGDQSSSLENRPYIPGDPLFKGDMFPSPEPFISGTQDMFGHTRKNADIGIDDLFSAHVPYIPDDPLYAWTPNH